jgi:hypothetical protein
MENSVSDTKKNWENIKKGWSVFFVSKGLRATSFSIPNGQPKI